MEGDVRSESAYTRLEISILALVWRATFLGLLRIPEQYLFNPRPRVEGDIMFKETFIMNIISILALVWRATG